MMQRRMIEIPDGIFKPIGTEGTELCQPCGDWTFLRFRQAIEEWKAGAEWTPPTMQIFREDEGKKLRQSSCPDLSGGNVLIFRSDAQEAMNDLCKNNGQFLPLDCPSEDIALFVPSKTVDALNEEASTVRKLASIGKIYMVECPVFYMDRLVGVDIFTIPQASGIYVSQNFVRRWTSAGLDGLNFHNTAHMTPGWWRRGGKSLVK